MFEERQGGVRNEQELSAGTVLIDKLFPEPAWRSRASASSEGDPAAVVTTIRFCSGERAIASVCCVTVTAPTTGWCSS
jgi:hypothetical protein